MAERTEDRLFELAEEQAGLFALRDVVAEGVPATYVHQLLARGRLERVSRGVYRLARFPETAHADLWAAILWPVGLAGVRGVLSSVTALMLHGGTDVNPSEIHVSIPKALRVKDPPLPLKVHHADVAPENVVYREGMPVTSPRRTLVDLRGQPRFSRWANELEAGLLDGTIVDETPATEEEES
jgi:predicted transcriptional regulator of viral defense system